MRLLEINYRIALESRQRPDIWYAAAQVRLSSAVKRRLDIEEDNDDLGSLSYAYLEAESIAISFQRYKDDPPNVFTLQIDAPTVALKRKVGVFSFVAAIIASMDIGADNMLWINKNLNSTFPAPRLKKTQIDDFVRVLEMDISEKYDTPEKKYSTENMSRRIKDLRNIQKRANDISELAGIVEGFKKKTKKVEYD